MHIIPVISPTVQEERLQIIMKTNPEGIKILAGFGISRRDQIERPSPFVHATIGGSALIREIMKNEGGDVYRSVMNKIKDLPS